MSTAQVIEWGLLSDEAKVARAVSVLKEKGAIKPCPRCETQAWMAELLAVGASKLPLPGVGTTLGPYIPVLSMACSNCGFQAFHNLIVLGVMPR